MRHIEIPSPPQPSFVVLGLEIRYYALFILAGIIVALLVGARRLKLRGAEAGLVLDVAIWTVPLGIIGGRLFHVVTHWADYFGPGHDLWKIVDIKEGGLAIYGALIFGLGGAAIGSRLAGIRLSTFLDVIAPGVILAQGIGRWGNYFNQELFGVPTTLPWGLKIDRPNPAIPMDMPAGQIFLPTFLYEFIWDIACFGILLLLDKRFELRWGKLFACYLMLYSAGRFWIEGLRIDPSDYYLGLRTNQWSAIIAGLIGMAIFLYQRSNHTGVESSVYLPGREPKPTEEAVEKTEY